MNLNIILMTIVLSEPYLNLTDWLVEQFGKEGATLFINLVDALFDVLNYFIPIPEMWDEVFERLFA